MSRSNSELASALGTQTSGESGPEYRQDGIVGLNGNDVSLDSERVEAAQNGEQMQASAVFLHEIDNRSRYRAPPQPEWKLDG